MSGNAATTESTIKKKYLELLKGSLLNDFYIENDVRLLYLAYMHASGRPIDWRNVTDPSKNLQHLIEHVRHNKYLGQVWYTIHDTKTDGTVQSFDFRNVTDFAYTMIGRPRMDNIEQLLDKIRIDGIEGDLLETGVCRGGAVIFMRGYLAAYGITDKIVWAADSFEGLPKPTHEADTGYDLSKERYPVLAISLEQVQETFRRYGLLDEQVRFLKGWFCDTLPVAPIEKLSLLRLDGDLYESTMDSLVHMYHNVSQGGFIIVDDYGTFEPCRRAVIEFRERHNITDKLIQIDPSSVFWRKQ